MHIGPERIKRPDCELAHSFQIATCDDDPECGAHVIAYDRKEKALCEIVMSVEQTRDVIKALQSILYEKAVTHG